MSLLRIQPRSSTRAAARWPARLAPLLSAAALAGCAALGPPIEVPPSQAPAVPAQWSSPLPHEARVADLNAWWQTLGDPLAAELVAAAQQASPTLATADARMRQSRADRAAAQAALRPSLNLGANAQRSSTQPGVSPITTVDLGAQASWELDLFGANAHAARAADERLAGSLAQWHEGRVSVAAETAALYFRQRACERQWRITAADAESRARTNELTALSMRAGFTAPATAALARASAAEAAERVIEQRSQCALDVKALVALTAWSEAELRARLDAAPLDLAPAARLEVAGVPAALLAQRPDLYRLARGVAAASADLQRIDALRYPQLTLNGSIGVLGYRAGGTTSSMPTWSIGPLSVSWPVTALPRLAVEVDAARARYDEAAALYRAGARDAVREVEQALTRLDAATRRAEDAARAAQGYREWQAATQARYDNGMASLVDLEDARRTALASTQTVLAVQAERIQAWIALYRALGGGWTDKP